MMTQDKKTCLRGMTWDHTRGYLPLVASAQRYGELNPEIEIAWEKRSLKDFEEYPIEVLAERYDLIVIDHPFVGYAAKGGSLLPLDEHLPEDFLVDQAENSVGQSHSSYRYDGHQWALAIDAATPVAFWREDLISEYELEVPRTWEDTLQLARSGRVEIPAAPINCLMNFYSLCVAAGEPPFRTEERVVSREVGEWAIWMLWELVHHCSPGCLDRNPIGSHDLLANSENRRLVYCPLAYGYSNYAREGYAAKPLVFGDAPQVTGFPMQTTLGGTGLAVSASSRERAAALDYAQFAASGLIQRTLWTASGGQAGHRSAWLDHSNNNMTNGYFERTLPTLERAYLRPRYCGYLSFQSEGALLLHAVLRGEMEDREALSRLDTLYRKSLDGEE